MTISEIMKDELPPYNPTDNVRAYHLKRLTSFANKPSISKAQELEQLGYCVDYDWITTGAEPKQHEGKYTTNS
jgi:hypothetical protein